MILTAQGWNSHQLKLWLTGGKMRVVTPPTKPYFWSLRERLSAVPYEKILLSSGVSTTLYKVEVNDTKQIYDLRDEWSCEADIPYVQRVAIDHPMRMHTEPPKILAYDLEMVTDNYFPNPEFDPITTLSTEEHCYDGDEADIINSFVREVKEKNPDLIADYFGNKFDMPYMLTRAHKLGIRLAIGRDGSEPWLREVERKVGHRAGVENMVKIEGRLHFDVWREADQDLSLSGIKNKQLKTVAKWFNIPVIEVDRTELKKLTREQLRAYNQSDAKATYKLAQIYLANLMMLADYLGIPLQLAIERHPSHLGNYVYFRAYGRKGVVIDQCNIERWPELFKTSYQGAIVRLHKKGLFWGVRKLDFKSMYPMTLAAFYLDPLTTRVVKQGPPTGEPPKFGPDWLEVEDHNLMLRLRLQVDLNSSITRDLFLNWLAEREQIKKALKENPDNKEAESRQDVVKRMMNATYGYHGNAYTKAGSVPLAIATTALGRWFIETAVDYISKLGAVPIEDDTDGDYYKDELDLAGRVTELIQSRIPEPFDAKLLRVEGEEYKAGIFYEAKNYVLLDKKDRVLMHGSGLKGKHLPKVCDKAVDRIIRAIFANKDPLIELRGLDMAQFSQGDFVMVAEISKDPNTYWKTSMYKQLVLRLKAVTGKEPRWGDEIMYLKTKAGYEPLGSQSAKVDEEYYLWRVADVCSRILSVTHQLDSKAVFSMMKGQTRL